MHIQKAPNTMASTMQVVQAHLINENYLGFRRDEISACHRCMRAMASMQCPLVLLGKLALARAM